MTFMLNYAWRRQANGSKVASGHQSPSPLAVQVSEDTSMPEDEDCDENRVPPPPTPEGLRPRKSLQCIREELGIAEEVFPQHNFGQWPPVACIPPKASPQVTNSSFYSRDSSSQVAESPDLGKARTAVGALVGKSQGIVSKKTSVSNAQDGRLGMLPPRTWNEEEESDDDISYQRLHDSTEAWTPGKQPQYFPGSPQSTVNSSIHPSPATRAWREWQQQDEEKNVSFSSRAALVPGNQEQGRPSYNFDSIEPMESRQDMHHNGPSYVVASDTNMANVSILSQSSAPINAPLYERAANYAAHNDSIHSLDSVQYSSASQSRANGVEREEDAMENALMQRKMKNQRRAKEQMLVGTVQRLQHNLDLISEIDALHEEDERWFVKTRMDSEGLITGFSKATRANLRAYVQSLLHEMNVARPEDFILSPSQISSMADTHVDLHDALVFLDGILQIAIPLLEQNPGQRWSCKTEIRRQMGIRVSESPETIRGGDTSLFSLPSETATPCTSNVSLATTITSKPSPYDGSHKASQIRRTIEIVSTLLQKMTTACQQLVKQNSSQDSIRATEEIKRNYLQLMSMNNHDIRSVVEAFIVEEPLMPLMRAVSIEDDQLPMERREQTTCFRNMPLPQGYPNNAAETLCVMNKIAQTNGSWQDMFSPCTDDMKSVPIENDEEYEADDLRRTVGSNDYDDQSQSEERDAPEDDRQESNSSDKSTPLRNMVYYTWGGAELSATPMQRK